MGDVRNVYAKTNMYNMSNENEVVDRYSTIESPFK